MDLNLVRAGELAEEWYAHLRGSETSRSRRWGVITPKPSWRDLPEHERERLIGVAGSTLHALRGSEYPVGDEPAEDTGATLADVADLLERAAEALRIVGG